MKSQKAEEDSHSKGVTNESRGFIVLKTQLAIFHGSRNKQVILHS